MMRQLAAVAALALVLPLASAQGAERENYLCYGTKTSFDGANGLTLADSFNTVRTYNAAKAKDLCLPASKDGDVAVDATTALTSYQIKLASGVKAVSALDRVLTSPIDLGLRSVKPAYLMVPANTCLPPASCGGLVAPTAGTHDVDAYTCYSSKVTRSCASNSPSNRGAACTSESACGGTDGSTTYCGFVSKFPKGLTATVTDAITTNKTFNLKKPSHVCTAAELGGNGRLHAEARMACYQVKGAEGSTAIDAPEGVLVADQFGLRELDVKKEHELCVAACDAPSPYLTKISSLQIGLTGEPGNGLDVDGNPLTCAPTSGTGSPCSGGVDNAFAAVASLVNGAVTTALTDGSIMLLLEVAGVNLTGGGTAALKVRTASLDPDDSGCDYQAEDCDYFLSNTCDISGAIAATLNGTGTTLTGGGPGYDLVIGVPIGTSSVPLAVHNLKVSATVTSSSGRVTGINGILGGAFVKQELVDTINSIPELAGIGDIVQAVLPADLDLDNDTVAESTSLGLVFSSIEARVTGIQP